MPRPNALEHYEIAGYGCVRTYAQLLGNKRAAQTLQKTLDEEGDTDKTLTKLSKAINVEAEEAPKVNGKGKKAGKGKSMTEQVLSAVGF